MLLLYLDNLSLNNPKPNRRNLPVKYLSYRLHCAVASDADHSRGSQFIRDLSFLMVKEALLEAARNGLLVDFLQMDALSLAFKENSFDGALFSFNAMDHMVGYKGKVQVLSQILRVLKPRATFIFSAHRIWSPPHLSALIRGGLKLNLGKILGMTYMEKEWGELYNLNASNGNRRFVRLALLSFVVNPDLNWKVIG